MKNIPIEELAAISAEIYEAAVRVGCTHVNITGKIWPRARTSGSPEDAARFVEFSWLRAAAINGRAVFEDEETKAYAELLVRYGLEDAQGPEDAHQAAVPKEDEPEKIKFTVELLPITKLELERQAKAEGITVGELLNWKFQPRIKG